ncbi:hypothetical protein Baya_12654 [Bagarius yarrelli]|uniref:Uncharacterized protein n=1 Tax=Bagarius yarrelli TaxID=175774 RepID=A0A556V449_BAGYA|nr:hypothetical protein Baya_12654 [Bagarius yarrelli]
MHRLTNGTSLREFSKIQNIVTMANYLVGGHGFQTRFLQSNLYKATARSQGSQLYSRRNIWQQSNEAGKWVMELALQRVNKASTKIEKPCRLVGQAER